MDDYMETVVKLVDLRQDMPLNQIVYKGLRSSIIKGIIPVRERINEKKYSVELNVSRTLIREALYCIYDEGLIEHIPNSGFVVKKVTVDDVEEIYKIRIALDTLASINAMNLMTDENFRDILLLDDSRRKKAFDEHKLIYYCLRDKDVHEITNLIKKHLDYSKRFIIEKIKIQEDSDL